MIFWESFFHSLGTNLLKDEKALTALYTLSPGILCNITCSMALRNSSGTNEIPRLVVKIIGSKQVKCFIEEPEKYVRWDQLWLLCQKAFSKPSTLLSQHNSVFEPSVHCLLMQESCHPWCVYLLCRQREDQIQDSGPDVVDERMKKGLVQQTLQPHSRLPGLQAKLGIVPHGALDMVKEPKT